MSLIETAKVCGEDSSITFRGITKTYPDGAVALSPLDLRLDQGVLGILGPNGAGKSTLLNIIVLTLEPTTGERTYFGLDDRPAHRAAIRSWIGFLPQEMEVIPYVTGLELLTLTGQLGQLPLTRKQIDARAMRLLEAVELGDAANRRARNYSGGMLRRLGLAQALMHSPRLLVVDEPTAGLDPEERIRFRNIVTEIGDRIPVLVLTHIVEDIEATSSRLCILEKGRKIFDGSPRTLFDGAMGRLWLVPEGADLLSPEGDQLEPIVVGHRSDAEQKPVELVLADSRPHPEARPSEPSLEEAYAVFLADSVGRAVPSEEHSAVAPGVAPRPTDLEVQAP